MRETAPERDSGAAAGLEDATMLSLAAFTATVERLQRPLSIFLRGVVGETELALDLTQDAFHDAWRATQRGDAPWSAEGDGEARRRWLFHDAYWRALSQMRRRKIIHWLPLEWPWSSQSEQDAPPLGADRPDATAPFEDRIVESDALRAALAKLAPEDAACLLLRAVEGFSAAEAAGIVGISPAAMAQRISRARRRLRAIYLAQNPSEERASGSATRGRSRTAERSDGDA